MNRILAALLCITTSISAQNIIIHNLDEALQQAKTEGLQVKQLLMQGESAKYDQLVAASGLMPSLNVSGTSDYNLKLPVQLIPAEIFGGPAGTYNQVRFGQPWNSSATGTLEVPIFHAVKYAQLKAAQANRQKTEADVNSQINSYLQNVSQVYLSVLVLRDAFNINQELDSTAALLYESTKARFEQKLVSQVDLNRAENLMLNTYQQTNSVKANLGIVERQLASMLGLSPSNLPIIEDKLSNYEKVIFDKIELKAEDRHKVKSAQLAEQAAKWNLKQQAFASLPKLSFNSRYTYANQSETLFSGTGTNFNYGTVGMSISMPIFKGFSLHSQRNKAKLQSTIASIQLNQTLIDSERELNDWNERLAEKQKSGSFAYRRNEMASTTLNLSLMNYDQGVISLDQLFNIYNEYAAAKNSYLQTRADAVMYEQWLKIEKK
jgi:outer membrane protein